MFLIDPLGQIAKTNDAKRKSDLEQLQRTLETYYNDNGKYPPHSTSTNSSPCGSGYVYRIMPATGCIDWGLSWDAYKTILPKDPTSSTRTYVYFASADLQSYWLYANLEKTNDPQICSGLVNGECSSLSSNLMISKPCGPFQTKPCNYGVSSPNVSP